VSALKSSVFLLFSTILISGCDRVKLDLNPSHFSECQGSSVAVHVHWLTPQGTAKPVSIYVNRVGSPETLWVSGRASGEADTGSWMSDGSTLSLRDGKGALLARRTVISTPCKRSATK
jgi:hypothetical protein